MSDKNQPKPWAKKKGPTNPTLLAKQQGTLATSKAAAINIEIPGVGSNQTFQALQDWVWKTGFYIEQSNVKQACSDAVANSGKFGNAHYNGKPVQHASHGSGKGGLGSCTLFYVYDGTTLKIMALGQHAGGNSYLIHKIYDGCPDNIEEGSIFWLKG